MILSMMPSAMLSTILSAMPAALSPSPLLAFTPALLNGLSYSCMGIGLWFWLWGTWPLLGDRSVLYKLHGLSVSDTLGSMLIIVGLLLKIPREWPLLVLALISLAIWNTVLGYVLAYCSTSNADLASWPPLPRLNADSPDEAATNNGNSLETSHDG